MIGVGVDFGTSNSTVAWFDGRQLRFVAIETNSPILPTAVHLSKEYEGTTGAAAIERYVQENTARLVHLVPEILGAIVSGTKASARQSGHRPDLRLQSALSVGGAINSGATATARGS
jgi:molecular chaperone DnaK (HSP70)